MLANLKQIDLTRLFEDAEETVYVDACCHFNLEGNEIPAGAIAQVICEDLRRPSS